MGFLCNDPLGNSISPQGKNGLVQRLHVQEERSCPGLMPLTPAAAAGKGGEDAQFISVLLNSLSLKHFPPPEMLPKVLLGRRMFGNYIVAALPQSYQIAQFDYFYYYNIWGF